MTSKNRNSFNFIPLFENKKFFNHSSKLPHIFRMAVVGKSGSGKTVLTTKMLLHPTFLDYNRLFIYSKMIESQPEIKKICYAFNKSLNKDTIIEMFNKGITQDNFNDYADKLDQQLNLKQQVVAKCASSLNEMNDENSFDETKKNLVIFDDYQKDNLINDLAESLYENARKKNVNLIYIGQRFKTIPILIRSNLNFVISFVQSKPDADLFFTEVLSRIMDRNDFLKMIRKVWNNEGTSKTTKNSYGYIAVNLDTNEIYTDIFIDEDEEED